jgi:protein-S-isoprenylcysteine O-methyltransferase Ste14
VAHRMGSAATFLLMIVSAALFLGLSAWGWGSWSGLLSHPARAAACVVILLASIVAGFTGISLSQFSQVKRVDARLRWVIAAVIPLGLALAGLPAYADRRDLGTIDGDTIRYFGLTLLIVGIVFRVGPMFVLEHRFGWPGVTQEHHELVTTGLYRVIRHPSYLGVLLGMVGWVLVFRSEIGPLFCLLLIPIFFFVIPAEEAVLISRFGDAYAEYQRRTWRLLPFLY